MTDHCRRQERFAATDRLKDAHRRAAEAVDDLIAAELHASAGGDAASATEIAAVRQALESDVLAVDRVARRATKRRVDRDA